MQKLLSTIDLLSMGAKVKQGQDGKHFIYFILEDMPDHILEARSYEKNGEKVNKINLKANLIELKKEKQTEIQDYNDSKLVRTHFAVVPQTKGERERKEDSKYCGGAMQFISKSPVQQEEIPGQALIEEEYNDVVEQIPF